MKLRKRTWVLMSKNSIEMRQEIQNLNEKLTITIKIKIVHNKINFIISFTDFQHVIVHLQQACYWSWTYRVSTKPFSDAQCISKVAFPAILERSSRDLGLKKAPMPSILEHSSRGHGLRKASRRTLNINSLFIDRFFHFIPRSYSFGKRK